MSLAFSVVICTYLDERWGRLCQAVRSVQAQTLPPSEVIVVVDHNESLLARARQELDGVSVVENAEAPGLRGARNSAWRAAKTSHVAYMDDDAEASTEWLEHLAEPFGEPDVAGVGGLTRPVWEGRRPAWLPPEFEWIIGGPHPGTVLARQEVRNLWGGNMSFARDLIATLGGFRLGFPDDETELCIRLRQRWPHKRLIWVPEAVVVHHVDAPSMTVRRFLTRCYSEGESKAVVAQLCGAKDALASERQYTREVLPRGVANGLRDFVLRADAAGAARATLIVAGLTSAAGGYLLARTMPTRAVIKRGLRTPASARERRWFAPLVARATRLTSHRGGAGGCDSSGESDVAAHLDPPSQVVSGSSIRSSAAPGPASQEREGYLAERSRLSRSPPSTAPGSRSLASSAQSTTTTTS